MKKLRLSLLVVIALLLAACNGKDDNAGSQGSVNDGEKPGGFGAIDHGIDDKKIGFNLAGGSIEEAANVPKEEKKQILEVFDVYIEALNEKDVDRYIETLSQKSESFDLEGERVRTSEFFRDYDLIREVSDVTIVNYTDGEAQVFAKLKTSMKQLGSGLQTNQTGRQVTVFTKDDGKWKVASVHYVGDLEEK